MKRFFVSSTFRDFQLERDLINDKIYPYLNSQTRQYNEYFSFLDLRWGIDTDDMDEESSSIKVINFCLDEVKRSKPYFILFLGDYYGYKADKEIIKKEANRHDLVLEDYDLSMTELEVRYALKLIENDVDHLLIYFRDVKGEYPSNLPFGDDESHHLARLKADLEAKYPNNIRHYDFDFSDVNQSLSLLEEKMKNDLVVMIRHELESDNELSKDEKGQNDVLNYFTIKASSFSARKEEENYIYNLVSNNHLHEAFIVEGEAGSGKTTLLAKIAMELYKDRDAEFFFFECGYSSTSGRAGKIMVSIANLICNRYNIEADNTSSIYTYYIDALRKLDSLNKKTYIFIDGLDQLSNDMELRELIFLIPGLKNITFIVSRIKGSGKSKLGVKVIELKELTANDKKLVIKSLLSDLGKELNEEVINIIDSSEKSNNPLFLSLIVGYLSLYDKNDFLKINSDKEINFSKYQIETIKTLPNSLDEMALLYLKKIVGEDEKIWTILYLIVLSHHGLTIERINQLCEKLKIGNVDESFYRVIDYIPEFFLFYESGEIDFFHRSFKYGLLSNLDEKRKRDLYIALFMNNYEKAGPREDNIYYAYQLRLGPPFYYNYSMNRSLLDTIVELLLSDGAEGFIEMNKSLIYEKEMIPNVIMYRSICYIAGVLYEYLDYKSSDNIICNKALESLAYVYEYYLEKVLLDKNTKVNDVLIYDSFVTPYDELANSYECFNTTEGFEKALEAINRTIEIKERLSKHFNHKLGSTDNYVYGERKYIETQLGANKNVAYIEELEKEIAEFESHEIIPDEYEAVAKAYAEYGSTLVLVDPKNYLDKAIEAFQKSLEIRKKYLLLDSDNSSRMQMYLLGIIKLLESIFDSGDPKYQQVADFYMEELEKTMSDIKPFTNFATIHHTYTASVSIRAIMHLAYYKNEEKGLVSSIEALIDCMEGYNLFPEDTQPLEIYRVLTFLFVSELNLKEVVVDPNLLRRLDDDIIKYPPIVNEMTKNKTNLHSAMLLFNLSGDTQRFSEKFCSSFYRSACFISRALYQAFPNDEQDYKYIYIVAVGKYINRYRNEISSEELKKYFYYIFDAIKNDEPSNYDLPFIHAYEAMCEVIFSNVARGLLKEVAERVDRVIASKNTNIIIDVAFTFLYSYKKMMERKKEDKLNEAEIAILKDIYIHFVSSLLYLKEVEEYHVLAYYIYSLTGKILLSDLQGKFIDKEYLDWYQNFLYVFVLSLNYQKDVAKNYSYATIMLQVLLTVFEDMGLEFTNKDTYDALAKLVDSIRENYDPKEIFQEYMPLIDKYFPVKK